MVGGEHFEPSQPYASGTDLHSMAKVKWRQGLFVVDRPALVSLFYKGSQRDSACVTEGIGTEKKTLQARSVIFFTACKTCRSCLIVVCIISDKYNHNNPSAQRGLWV